LELNKILLIGQKESRESLRNRWFIVYAVSFSALALLLLFIGSSKSTIGGYTGFGRTAASLINLILLFIPLISLTIGSIAISVERENKTLPYLLSHPVSKSEILLGKYIGILISIWLTLIFGFGISGIVISTQGIGQGLSGYIMVMLLSGLLASSFLSIGFIVSVMSSRTSKSVGIAVFLWLAFLIFGDLGVMGSAISMDLGPQKLFFLTAANPAEAFKIASILTLSQRVEILGPAGVYAVRVFGETLVFIILLSVLFFWTLIPLMISALHFCYLRREEK